jgi:hypothetical protein
MGLFGSCLTRRKCEFFNTCPSSSKDSAVCTREGGGNYCGKYRELKKKQEKCE